METHVKVKATTREKLNSLKASLGLKSVDDVIQELLSRPTRCEDGPSSNPSDEEPLDEPAQKRKKLVREPLFSYESLADRDGMLEYYTGLDSHAFGLLLRRLEEVR